MTSLPHFRLHSAASLWSAIIALVGLLSVGGYLVTSEMIERDRQSQAARRAVVESLRTQALLDRARAYVVGLGNLLAAQPTPGPRRFADLVGSTAGGAGLVDALWVQSVPASERGSFERRLGAPIARLTSSGALKVAPPAASYLPATYTTGTRPELRPGVDVSNWPALAAAIRNQATVFAVTASRRASLDTATGFFLLESASFGRGPDSKGYLAVFVPRGWLSLSLGDDPRQVAIGIDGRPLGGRLTTGPAAATSFRALARDWRVAAVAGPPSGLQSLTPWLALGWPIAAALLGFLGVHTAVRRRRAERGAERVFDLSLDLLAIVGLDGYFKRINPAFERTLGYSREHLLTRPLFEFVHPEDVDRTRAALESLGRGQQLVAFENRNIRHDGSLSWLEWNVQPVADEGAVYAAARDVTQRRRSAQEQAGLRRVATLVAHRAPPEEVFAAVAEEVGQVVAVEHAHLGRYESDGTVTFVAVAGATDSVLPVGTRMTLGGRNVSTIVRETGRPARIDYADASGPLAEAARGHGVRSSAGAPIIVDGHRWGVMIVSSSREGPLAVDAEARLASFTELVATAIANTESRTALARLAEEQAALRRVATLVARGARPTEVFAAVTGEIAQLLAIEFAIMGRYEPDNAVSFVGTWGTVVDDASNFVSRSWALGGNNVTTEVARTGRAARVDGYAGSSDALDVAIRDVGVRSSVGTPLVVDGRLWGVVIAGSAGEPPLPADTEVRLASYTELLAMAIANAESRAALAASRARVVAAADDTRRRLERDLHDGIQQRLVSLALELRAVQAAVPPGLGQVESDLVHLGDGLASVFDELREITRGIHPAILSEGGLEPALRALRRRSAVPVELRLHLEHRLPEHVEVAAYHVVSEALANAAKHSRASGVTAELDAGDTVLRVVIRDDGVGGADPGRGMGLVALSDRVEALAGTLELTSPAGHGTTLVIEIPFDARGGPGSPAA